MGMRSYKRILDDITCDSCRNHYCILKELILRLHHPDARATIQIKCVDKFKYEQSAIVDQDIGWQNAFNRWVDEGYAAAYAAVWDEDKTFQEVYKDTCDIVKAQEA